MSTFFSIARWAAIATFVFGIMYYDKHVPQPEAICAPRAPAAGTVPHSPW